VYEGRSDASHIPGKGQYGANRLGGSAVGAPVGLHPSFSSLNARGGSTHAQRCVTARAPRGQELATEVFDSACLHADVRACVQTQKACVVGGETAANWGNHGNLAIGCQTTTESYGALRGDL
jgi:hypothetical protein